MDLSIVIPVFEESRKIAHDINDASKFLTQYNLEGEIIIADDGSKDGTSETAKKVEVPDNVKLTVLRSEEHYGKGHAVRRGIIHSSGDYVMFADSGCCVPYKDALKGLELIKSGKCDIAHGSRKTIGCNIERAQSLSRRICSKIFHWYVVYDLKIPQELADTQCGFKIYKGDVARKLYKLCQTDGFVFDIEIIMLALRQGFKIAEFPIRWRCDRDTRLSPSRSSWRILKDLMQIKRDMSKVKA